ncbi:MAG: ATP-binding protein [Jatrophihabitans sp.]|nr:MAG: ATP-binding protein [Jatrophihabitans sp.]
MTGDGLADLLARVREVERRIRHLVAARRADDPQPDDPFRGLYLSDEAIDRLLAQPPVPPVPLPSPAAPTGRLAAVAERFGLDPLDVELLLTALAGDVDPRFEQFFGYLNDDVTRRRPSVAVALALCGLPVAGAAARARLVDGPLLRGGLVEVDDPERPFASRAVRVPDRVVAHLLGHDAPDRLLAEVLVQVPDLVWGDPSHLAGALAAGVAFCYLREPPTGSGQVLAARALAAVGLGALGVDLARLAAAPDAAVVARAAAREARLTGAGLIVVPVPPAGLPAHLAEALTADPCPVLLVGEQPWDPAWSRRRPLLVDVPPSTPGERAALWQSALAAAGGPPGGHGPDRGRATQQFLLRPEQVSRAAAAAVLQARLAPGEPITAAHLQAGARSENGSALQRLARRIEPAVGWSDLVLPAPTRTALEEVALRARHRERVLGEWGMRPGGGRGMGVAALFAGDSGTGKTMSAEVIAASLGLDLYVVDLATVVDKYVGETEKNLERIFTAASGVNGVLLFDEADAVFGKRSEVRDAHDRYANVESAYLLQRMESFDGLVILATNLRANIDEAFTRRLDVLVDFPLPDEHHRRLLWDRCLGATVGRAPRLDLGFCAGAFDLAGGAIRAACVTAAYLAAEDDGPITMAHVITAVQREYRKLGRLCLQAEFGPYYELIA